jgi:hypothetical protein
VTAAGTEILVGHADLAPRDYWGHHDVLVSQTARFTPAKLRMLRDAVTHARARVEVERSASETARFDARARLLSALESYAAALAAHGAPLPDRLRAELNLYRALHQAR